jgi:hypothetical protein
VAKKNEEKQLKTWDARPSPSAGDGDIERLYAAVGRALHVAAQRGWSVISIFYVC